MEEKMKSIKSLKSSLIKYTLMTVVFVQALFWKVALFAQEEGGDLDVDVEIGGGGDAAWYTAWWVWIVGIALFIIIIVAIVSAGRSRER